MNNIEMGDDLSLLRTPPHSVEAEQSVLGGLMLDNLAWDKINDIVHEDDFYRFDQAISLNVKDVLVWADPCLVGSIKLR